MITNSTIENNVRVGVVLACEQLTNDELAALNLAASAGFNPTGIKGYEKVKGLFTEENGAKMHPQTLAAFQLVVSQRLG